jgi:cellulose synthase/poly-beta-1,6-N-acetylglucosamine synthase-like glycosyltransferase
MITLPFVVIAIVYALFILLSWLGWKQIKSFEHVDDALQTRVSIIVPARNEEKNIVSCLNAIAAQSYPQHLTEIIISDDNSGDQTAAFVKNWIASNNRNAKIISAGKNRMGKKHALNEAVKNAAGELIVTTDADCTMNTTWLSSIVSYYEKHSPYMICGMVSIRKENNFLSAFQSLEQLGLTAIGAAGIYFRRPLMCNGANLAYTKKVFEELGGYNPFAETASGDDTQLMFRTAKQNPSAVHFLKSKEAIVYTDAASSLAELFSQRKRWGSKVLKQKNFTGSLAGFIVFLFHLFLVAGFVLACTAMLSWKLFLLLFILKIIPEFILLNSVVKFFGKKNLWKYSLPSQFIYPFYLAVAALLSQTGTYTWKERKVQ